MDGLDNNRDGLIDCGDPQCEEICFEGDPHETHHECLDGEDNNRDGLTDCDDPGCAGRTSAKKEMSQMSALMARIITVMGQIADSGCLRLAKRGKRSRSASMRSITIATMSSTALKCDVSITVKGENGMSASME